jgi:hypothetical protein
MRDPRKKDLLKIRENPVHRLPVKGRRRRELRPDLSRFDRRHDRKSLDLGEVIGDPVDKLMGVSAEILVIHGFSPDMSVIILMKPVQRVKNDVFGTLSGAFGRYFGQIGQGIGHCPAIKPRVEE